LHDNSWQYICFLTLAIFYVTQYFRRIAASLARNIKKNIKRRKKTLKNPKQPRTWKHLSFFYTRSRGQMQTTRLADIWRQRKHYRTILCLQLAARQVGWCESTFNDAVFAATFAPRAGKIRPPLVDERHELRLQIASTFAVYKMDASFLSNISERHRPMIDDLSVTSRLREAKKTMVHLARKLARVASATAFTVS